MGVKTVITATCMNCEETGTTQAWAEKHTNDLGHATITHETPVYEAPPEPEPVPEVKHLEDEPKAKTGRGKAAAPASDG